MGPLANEFLGIPDYDCNWLLHWCICWHSNNRIDLCTSGSTHVGYVCIVFIRTHPTFSSCFHGHKCDCAWCMCDLSNELWMITTIVQHLPYKSNPNRRKVFPVPSKTAVHIKKELCCQFLVTIFLNYDLYSENHVIVMWLRPSGAVTPSGGLEEESKLWVRSRFGKPKALIRFAPRGNLIPGSREEIWWAEFVPNCTTLVWVM